MHSSSPYHSKLCGQVTDSFVKYPLQIHTVTVKTV
jgi:hypothetical protein